MNYLPTTIKEAIIWGVLVFIAIIVFLWGKAIGQNEACENKIHEAINCETLKLRRENKALIHQVKELTTKNELYLRTLSGLRYLLRKGEE